MILSPDGTITITGNKVSIEAEKSVNLRGKVNYQIGSPAAAPKVEALPPLLAEEIPQITPAFPHSL